MDCNPGFGAGDAPERLTALAMPGTNNTTSYFKRPFMLLTWFGQKGLDGEQMALHFTYGGNGLIGFDLSAIKTENGMTLQSNCTRRIIDYSDSELMTNVFHMSSMVLMATHWLRVD